VLEVRTQPVVALAGLAFAVTLWLIARGAPGAFLSDDFSHLAAIFNADDRGQLWAWTLARFYEPLGSGNFAYRPIAFVTYVGDWLLYGADATGWHLTNLALYAADALIAGWLVRRWVLSRAPHATVAGAVATCVLAAFPFAGEIAFWPVGRFDLLAALFSLLCLASLRAGGDTPATVLTQLWRVTCLLAALLSKESALPLPVMAAIVSFGLGGDGESSRGLLVRARIALRATWPMWLAFAGYLAWRYWLFGSTLKVYPDVVAPHDLEELLQRMATVAFIVKGNIGSRYALWAAAVIVLFCVTIASALSARSSGSRSTAPLAAALAASAVLYFVAPWFGLAGAPASGEGGRHLFLAWVYLALFLGVVVVWRPWPWFPAIALVVVLVLGQAHGVRQWQAAASEMKAVTGSIAAFAASVRDDQYALLLLPDHVGIALFARNGQGGIVMRPTQRRDYLDRVAPMLSDAFEEWSARLSQRTGVVITMEEIKGRRFDPADFVGLFCWNRKRQAIVPLTAGGALARDAQAWRGEAERSFAAVGCMPPF
jgi:hypothetical protein